MAKKAIQTDGFYYLNVNRKWKWKRPEAISSIMGKLEMAKIDISKSEIVLPFGYNN